MKPPHRPHAGTVRNGRTLGSRARDFTVWPNGFKKPGVAIGNHCGGIGLARESVGIDWMRREEINQAIPPAYTEYIGRQLLQALAV